MALFVCSLARGGHWEGNNDNHCSKGLIAISGQPIVGTIQIKILLVEFQDVQCRKGDDRVSARYSSKDFEDMLGSSGMYVSPTMHSPDGDPVSGSMSDYFRAMSGGRLNVRATVVNRLDTNSGMPVWIRLDCSKSHYNQDKSGFRFLNDSRYAAEACGIDIRTSDSVKLVIIYAGNTSYDNGGLNPAAWESRYIMSELQGRPYGQEHPEALFSRIGIHCHEFAHLIGIGHSSGSTADLMCSGTKNGSAVGNVPAPLNPIARAKAGWVSVVPVDSVADGETDISYSLQAPVIFKMKNSNGDYFLIESRRVDQSMTIGTTIVPDYNNAASFPAAHPHGTITQGIFVWRVNATGDVLDPGYSTEGLLYASGQYGRTFPENAPSEIDDGVPFPGVCNVRVLSPWSDSRNPYMKEVDYFDSSKLHYTLFAPNTKGGTSWGMEILSEDREHGSFRVRFFSAQSPSEQLECVASPDSLGFYQRQRTVCRTPDGTVHQVLELGGEIFYRRGVPGTAGWHGVSRLSNGNGGNGAPSMTVASSDIVVVWQVQAKRVGSYAIHSRRSTDAGATWAEISCPAIADNCADSGPFPCVVGDWDGRAILAYATSTSVFFAVSSNGGKSWSNASRTFTFARVWGGPSIIMIKSEDGAAQASLVICADSVYGVRGIHYAVLDFASFSWTDSRDVSRIIPDKYAGFARPCFAISRVETESRSCLLWDAAHYDGGGKLIVCMDAAPDRVGTSFAVLKGKSLEDLDIGNLGQLPVGVEERRQPTAAEEFVLEQNYPNPFNPRTEVRSQMSEVRHVKLAVYDLLGREVRVLVDEQRAAGRYEDVFDGSGLASGVYFCRMTAGSFTQSRKMILAR